MRIDLTSEERLLILGALAREAHEQEEFASASGVVGTAFSSPLELPDGAGR